MEVKRAAEDQGLWSAKRCKPFLLWIRIHLDSKFQLIQHWTLNMTLNA